MSHEARGRRVCLEQSDNDEVGRVEAARINGVKTTKTRMIMMYVQDVVHVDDGQG